MTAPVKTDPPGTCHRVGCPGKGVHPPHPLIGAGSWEDYQKTQYCLGFPAVTVEFQLLQARCSIAGNSGWFSGVGSPLTPSVMAHLVDLHKAECLNRDAT